MPRRGILNIEDAQEAQLKTGEHNPFIKKFLGEIQNAASMQETADLTAEMLGSLIDQKFDPGTVKDFRKILFILIAASDSACATDDALSLTTQLAGFEIIKKLSNLNEIEEDKAVKQRLNKILSFLRFYAFHEAAFELQNLVKEQPKFKTISMFLEIIAEGANTEKLKISFQQYEEEVITEIFIRVNKMLHTFARIDKENADLPYGGKESILRELQLLQSMIDYHPSLQLKKEAQQCLDLLEKSPAIEKLSRQHLPPKVLAPPAETKAIRRFSAPRH